MIINAGIVRIVYQAGYADDLSREMLAEAQVELFKLEGPQLEVNP
jgi:deoxycytidylate deaminase